jgi:alcohol dehydrogenase class IV
MAINTTGTCFPHNVGYFLTETFGVPHGFASAAFMPAMIRLAHDFDQAYVRDFFEQVGISEEGFVALVESCLPAFDLPLTDAQIENVLPRWQDNGSVKNTRADITQDDIRAALAAFV